jgi:putative Mn2+ efflux pump MntP
MDLVSIILLSVALGMDCFSVSLTQGLCQRNRDPRAWLMALLFGLFQGGMPLIGYGIGTLFVDIVTRYAPWIALVLLGFIGIHMILDSLKKEAQTTEQANWSFVHLILLAIATSIDALATGVLFVANPARLWIAIAIIAMGSFVLSGIGYALGVMVGKRLRLNAGLIGGIILILIGIKICVEGLCS